MKMQHRPLQILLRSDTGKGDDGRGGPRKRPEKEWTVVRKRKKKGSAKEKSPFIKLGLVNSEQENHTLIKYRKNPVLNPAQLFEFQQQALIFKYMKAGLPVPLQLVIPVWKNVASSFGSDSGGFCRQYPSFVGFSPQEFDYKSMMDPEPGRCRRTDGKKWRCSKNVVSYQKYCERHMHRGRQRSRKLVEASQIASPSYKTSAKDAENSKNISSHSPRPKSADPFPSTPPSDLEYLKPISTLFQFMTPSSKTNASHDSNTTTTGRINDNRSDVMLLGISNSKSVVGDCSTIVAAAAAATTTSIPSLSKRSIVTTTSTDSKNDVSGSKNSIFTITVAPDTAAANTGMPANNPITLNSPSTGISITTTETVTAAATSSSNNNYANIDGKHDSNNCTSTKNMSRKSGSNTNTGSNPSAGLGFSPKSVLQVLGCSGIELEPGRCRRTDGKKWRCGREVVPDQKYCGRHMHRGAKKRVEASQPVATTAHAGACRPSAMIESHGAHSATLNTNLSISIPARPLVTNDEEKSPTSSSDATISDTTVTAYENANSCS